MEQLTPSGESPAWADTAMQLMQRHEVTPTPNNFQIWYSYAAGESAELTRTIDILIAGGRTFSPAWCDDLYARFFQPPVNDLEISEITENIEKSLLEAISHLGEAGTDTQKFGGALSSVHNILASESNTAPDLTSIVSTLVSATRQMQKRSMTLERKLQQSSVQLNEMRDDLKSIRAEALTDALTGLGNRKAFDQGIHDYAMQSMETGGDLCLLLGDIDSFKAINDQWGHQVGDNVLKLVSDCISQIVGQKGICTRYGGEEFCVILPDNDLQAAADIGNRIREALAHKTIRKRTTGEDVGVVTISFGVAQYAFGESLSNLVERADSALYQAKSAGRNQVITELSAPDCAAAASPIS